MMFARDNAPRWSSIAVGRRSSYGFIASDDAYYHDEPGGDATLGAELRAMPAPARSSRGVFSSIEVKR